MCIIRIAGKKSEFMTFCTTTYLEIFTRSWPPFVFWFAVFLFIVSVSIYIAGKFRGGAEKDTPVTSELISKFRELHEQGDLSDEEYRTIKTKLARRLQQELNIDEEKGSDESA